jgi:hypothetical protein
MTHDMGIMRIFHQNESFSKNLIVWEVIRKNRGSL